MSLWAKAQLNIFLKFADHIEKNIKNFKKETARRKYSQYQINITFLQTKTLAEIQLYRAAMHIDAVIALLPQVKLHFIGFLAKTNVLVSEKSGWPI